MDDRQKIMEEIRKAMERMDLERLKLLLVTALEGNGILVHFRVFSSVGQPLRPVVVVVLQLL